MNRVNRIVDSDMMSPAAPPTGVAVTGTDVRALRPDIDLRRRGRGSRSGEGRT